MSMVSDLVGDEILDVLFSIRENKDGTVLMTFINGAGEKVSLRLMHEAARDLCNELSDLGIS